MKKRDAPYPNCRLVGSIHKLLGGALIHLLRKVGCRAPRKYSPNNALSVQNGLDPEMVNHLGTKGFSPSMHFSCIIIEAKYLSVLARSSTSYSSLMVYPRSGTSSSYTIPLPLSVEVLAVLPEASAGCSTTTFRRRFLKPASTPELGCFSTTDSPASPTAGTLSADGASNRYSLHRRTSSCRG
ncbi:hypothetical protein B296_00001350 [Ensete ventricosum]|uniref:Uncharacterized protein n=1 Tax=Ensete ventricosum TaxID=4639 RepID=A0A426Z3I0_ENSVE|nr:hypothetical protein B296_00001350 [Ensete ventricosum]